MRVFLYAQQRGLRLNADLGQLLRNQLSLVDRAFLTDEHVRDTIVTGRRNMPPFNAVLNEKQIEDLMAFLHTL